MAIAEQLDEWRPRLAKLGRGVKRPGLAVPSSTRLTTRHSGARPDKSPSA
jgi:hypothetical protein